MTKVVLLHGNGGGTGADNWLPYIKKALNDAGVECLAPDMPDPKLGRAKYWIPYLHELGVDEDTILVGHSTGAIAAMKYAEDNHIKGSVLVGGYYTDLGDADEKASGYFDTPWDWQSIKSNQDWVVIFASSDDPWIPVEEAQHIDEMLSGEMHLFKDKGHFGYDTDMTEFPELLSVLKKKLGLN